MKSSSIISLLEKAPNPEGIKLDDAVCALPLAYNPSSFFISWLYFLWFCSWAVLVLGTWSYKENVVSFLTFYARFGVNKDCNFTHGIFNESR